MSAEQLEAISSGGLLILIVLLAVLAFWIFVIITVIIILRKIVVITRNVEDSKRYEYLMAKLKYDRELEKKLEGG